MGKKKKHKKIEIKKASIRFEVGIKDRIAFSVACKKMEVNMSEVLRVMIGTYVESEDERYLVMDKIMESRDK